MKFIRAFCYGLSEGESVSFSINGADYEFSFSNPQLDIPHQESDHEKQESENQLS